MKTLLPAAIAVLALVRLCVGAANCSSVDFPLDYDGLQCQGLSLTPAPNGLDDCVAACCAETNCSVYQYCPIGSTCSPAGTCWIGSINKGCSVSSGWQSRARPASTGPFGLSDDAGYWPFPLAGIGAISGGGATSNLLLAYPEPYLSQILDFLFLPNYGAALQVLKVEIGGEGLSTEGSEASHWRSRSEAPAFDRGYEWRIMVEAKKRNPDILLYGLPWAWPGWVAPGAATPFENVTAAVAYVVAWVAGAASTYNLTIDTLGIWNERSYNATYVKALRAALDAAGFQRTAIVCDDGGYACVADMMADPELAAAVSVIGGHGPPPADAYSLGKPLWWTEDYHALSRYGDPSSWAFQINQRFLQTNCTSVLAWNALDAFYAGMSYDNSGLMVSRWPWSGHYEVLAPVWATAHTTQFSRAGWRYLPNNTGGGLLALGGSYVTLVDAASTAAPTGTPPTWSLIIEKLCGYFYPICTAEEATFCISGGLLPPDGSNLSLSLWTSAFRGGDGSNDSYLVRSPTPVLLSAAAPCFPVLVDVNSMVTVTTTPWGGRGQPPAPPPPAAPFPLQYADDFSSCVPPAEAPLFADITGAYECAASTAVTSGVVMRQRTPAPPISWDRDTRPHGIIGDIDWADVNVTVDALFPEDAAANSSLMLAVRASFGSGSANVDEVGSPGLWFTLDSAGSWNVTTSIINATKASSLLLAGTSPVPVLPLTPLPVSLVSSGGTLAAFVGGEPAFQGLDVAGYQPNGFVGYGCVIYGHCADLIPGTLALKYQCTTTQAALAGPKPA